MPPRPRPTTTIVGYSNTRVRCTVVLEYYDIVLPTPAYMRAECWVATHPFAQTAGGRDQTAHGGMFEASGTADRRLPLGRPAWRAAAAGVWPHRPRPRGHRWMPKVGLQITGGTADSGVELQMSNGFCSFATAPISAA